MPDTNYLANKVAEYISTQFECDEAKKIQVYNDFLVILNTQVEEAKPKGMATIVQDEATGIEQFPGHVEDIAS